MKPRKSGHWTRAQEVGESRWGGPRRPAAEYPILDQIVKDSVRLQTECPLSPDAMKVAVSQRLAASGIGREGDLDELIGRIEFALEDQELQEARRT